MTPRKAPEPTTDTGYDSYLYPRSKTPELDALYDHLHRLGWRFQTGNVTWHPPESAHSTLYGRLEYAPDYSWATIQAPSDPDTMTRGPVLLRLVRTDGWWEVTP